jgi:hypothetical protein
MTPERDEAYWRNRFIVMNLVRIGATLVALFGLVLWQSDRIVAGGSILGFPIALAGLLASFFAPQYYARRHRTPPGP